ncbi:DUF3093 domain-containing protein [Corynebacterium lizhenjunii]|nr:DUF3093 domain-containing protein [Corynebacterium lizhenjunii]
MSEQGNNHPQQLYSERHWVPWYFWMNGFFVIVISTATFGLNRPIGWSIGIATVLSVIGVWVLLTWSSTTVRVEQDPDGTRWLLTKGAQLPADVVSRSLAVPESARRNALGPQLDPAAFLVTKGWMKEHVMLVLDDPEDDTPYWIIATKDPRAVLEAFVPEQAAKATATLR